VQTYSITLCRTFKAGATIFGKGSAAAGLQSMTGGKELNLDMCELEGMFAKPETKARVAAKTDEVKRTKISLLDAKRSTSVGIMMKRITDKLQGKEIRDALMEIDENLLPLEVLPMVREIAPTAEEAKLLTRFSGNVATLDRPEQMMRTLAHIPRLEGRLRSMQFKAQLEVDMDGVLMQHVDDLKVACEAVRESTVAKWGLGPTSVCC